MTTLNHTTNNVALTIHQKVSAYPIQDRVSLRSGDSLKTSHNLLIKKRRKTNGNT